MGATPDQGSVSENHAVAYDTDLADRIRELVRGEAGLSEKGMFGGLAFLVRGNMAISASGQGGVLVRVDPARTAELAARPHAEVAVMRGRAMDGWLRVEGDGVRTKAQLQRWVDEGVAYARSLPGKQPASR
jgi:hypothetical protein